MGSLAAEAMLILTESISLPEFQISTVAGEYARVTHQTMTLLGQPVWETINAFSGRRPLQLLSKQKAANGTKYMRL